MPSFVLMLVPGSTLDGVLEWKSTPTGDASGEKKRMVPVITHPGSIVKTTTLSVASPVVGTLMLQSTPTALRSEVFTQYGSSGSDGSPSQLR
jgi:hypothetical protein